MTFSSSTNLFWYTLGALLSALPIIFVKRYLTDHENIWIILAIVMNALLIYVYFILFQIHNTAISYSVIKILSVIIIVLIGIFIYCEKINIKITFGLIFGLLALYLLS